ncbi:MAG: molybdenum cofactor guanylyltransferase [Dehalococcoidia bacterium]|nr:MAG: molybdenum cofactor guanylyltransferase [Dehalococcoidia bacterium]
MAINGIVLVGGKGLRLRRDKALEVVDDKSLLERVVSTLNLFQGDIIIVTAQEQSLTHSIDYPKLRIVADAYPGKGALGGIYTGLMASGSLHNIVVACDMPFLSHDLLNYMVQLAPGYDVVVPRLGKMLEPLHAVYSRNCLTAIESLLKQNSLSITMLFSLVKARYVGVEEIDRFDPRHLSFFNINTEADLKRARELIREESQ